MAPGSTTRIKIDFAQGSDPGRDPNKQVNEDSCGYAETAFGHLIVLCDGMGGHYGGKEASRTAIATIFEVIEQTPPSTLPAMALKAAVEEAGRRVYRLGGPPENRARPGSTVVSMVLHDRGVDVAHVGDSRAYVIRSNQIYPLTRDHSMVQGMIDAGMLTEEQAIGHPDSNKITRALGMRPEVEVEVRPEPMELFVGDVLLTSSDGLTDLALGPDILGATRQALASGGVSNVCTQLIAMANSRGGHDNITVQIAKVSEVGPRPLTTIPQGPGVAQAPQGAAFAGAAQGAQPVPMTAPGATNSGAPLGYPPPSSQRPTNLVQPGQPQGAPMQQQGAPMQQQGAPMQWAPVPPTATDMPRGQGMPGAPPSGGGVGPTAPQQSYGAGPTWSSGVYGAATGQTGQNLAPYSMDTGAAALQLPPPAGAPMGVAPTQMPGGGYGPAPYGQMPQSMSSYPNARPSKGGVVFLIIGLSAAVAVLIVLLIWALFLH